LAGRGRLLPNADLVPPSLPVERKFASGIVWNNLTVLSFRAGLSAITQRFGVTMARKLQRHHYRKSTDKKLTHTLVSARLRASGKGSTG
jgi:hypothetical protein